MINTLGWVKITEGEHKGKKGVVLVDLGEKYYIRIVSSIEFLDDYIVRYNEEIKKEYVEKIKDPKEVKK